MGRQPRFLHKPGALVEVTQRTFQGRHLLKPSDELNARIVGCLHRAREKTGARIHCVAFLSTHFHILASFDSVEQMADFMARLKKSLSLELAALHRWTGTSWEGRYRSIPVSDEPEAQIARLRYLLGQGCKEGLVAAPRDWPGVHGAEALVSGRSLRGVWIDRTAYHRARSRSVRLEDFARPCELSLEALPCWRDQPEERWRGSVREIVESLEAETAAQHRLSGTAPVGVSALLAVDPWKRSEPLERTPAPWVHAYARRVREAMVEALRLFLAAYRAAAERLASGSSEAARFPPNCFPPRLPFVAPDPPGPG
ncbi:MAG: transposase [Acidobacteriota bacterium]